MNEKIITNDMDFCRRNFLTLSAGAAAGLVLAGIPEMSFAGASQKVKQIQFANCPSDPVETARSSELVQNSYKNILSSVKSIKDSGLRASVTKIIENPAPTFMSMYKNDAQTQAIYDKLLAAGYIDKAKMESSTKLFPMCKSTANAPQPFFSAPGSGYASHHSYPGGLAVHTDTNLCIADAICSIYKSVLGYDINRDVVIASEALHDLAKPWVFQWNADSSSFPELPLAGTGSHHVFSITESIYRKLPAEVIVAMACAHSHPGTAKDEADVVNWIKCAAMIAGVDPVREGLLNAEANGLPAPHKQEGYITHLADHDFVLSVPAAKKSIEIMKAIAKSQYGMTDADLTTAKFNKFRNYASAQLSMMRINNAMTMGNPEKSVTALLETVFA